MKAKFKLYWWKVKRQPFVSIAIVGINLAVFLLCIIFPWLYEKGVCGVYSVLVEKEYGRILWSMFLHGSAEHIFSNMIIVLFLGSMLETQVGHFLYGMVYLVSGLAADVFSLLVKWYQQDWADSLGASGAVFGLDGLLLAMALFASNRIELPIGRVIFVVFLSVYSGFTNTGIDNAAHVGGLFVGFLLGIPISIYIGKKQK